MPPLCPPSWLHPLLLLWHLLSLLALVWPQTLVERLTPPNQCLIWTNASRQDLCQLAPWDRLRHARTLFLFKRDCDSVDKNVLLGELLLLNRIEAQSDLRQPHKFEHLAPLGRECILAGAGSQRCYECFDYVDQILRTSTDSYLRFNETILRQFDCERQEFQRFSPNATCDHCRAWYRKWLLVESDSLGRLWQMRACPMWCHYAELACPHFVTLSKFDYAGLPSFRCNDPEIKTRGHLRHNVSWSVSDDRWQCDCIHPCDLFTGGLNPSPGQSEPDELQRRLREECEKRERHCKGRTRARRRTAGATTPRPLLVLLVALLWTLVDQR